MTIKPVHISHEPRLALIFAGWGMDERMFMPLRRGGYDIAVAFEYNTPHHLPSWIDEYSEICVIAWSYGVCMAERALHMWPQLPVTLKVAVNGTPTPINDTTGIPEAIYNGTLSGLNERSVYKFYRRMCMNANEFGQWKGMMPRRSLSSLSEELALFGNIQRTSPVEWDIVFIAGHDAIIPTQNQINAWKGIHDIRMLDCGHLPDFQSLMNEVLIDKNDVERKFSIHAETYIDHATVQRQMCEKVNDILRLTGCDRPDSMVEIGVGTGMLTRMYAEWMHPHNLQLWDLCNIPTHLPGTHIRCDAESAVTKLNNVDIIASSATIQWMNNPKLFVARCAAALADNGVAVFSTFGPNTFKEINHLLPASLRYLSANEWRGMKIDNCKITVAEEKKTLSFPSSRELLQHISLTGVNGCGVNHTASYRACRAILTSNITTLTYHCIYLTIKKHA